ncbi:MAG: translocation/assembly module TamB [Gemmatimonadetes bacterium]|nr:translocation/assembly module TamB [Gemmatimonadota bacterium]
MAGVVRTFAWLVAGILLLGVSAVGIAVVLARTQPGHEYLLRVALRQLSSGLNGEVEVAGIRAGNILSGFRLTGVSIRDPDGRPVFEADSLDVRYSFRDLLRKNVVLVPTLIWAPRVLIEQIEEGGPTNVELLLGTMDDGGGSSGFSVALRDVEISDGELVLRLPAAAGDTTSRRILEPTPGTDQLVQLFRFDGIDGRIVEADLLGDLDGAQRVSIDRLDVTAYVLDVPFRIEDFRGTVVRTPSAATVSIDRVRLGGSGFSGGVAVGWGAPGGEMTLDAELESDRLHLADLRWLEPRLPDGEGAVAIQAAGSLAEGEWRVTSAGFQIGGSQLSGTAGVRLGEPLRILPSDVELMPLELADLEPWVSDTLALDGRVRGRVTGSGELDRLEVAGELTYEDPRGEALATTARFRGTIGLGEEAAFSGLSVTLEPFHYEILSAFLPDLQLAGEGRVQATLTGSLAEGLELDGEVEHWGPDWPRSRVLLRGQVRDEGEDFAVGLDASLDLLSLDGLAGALDRELPVSGMVSGDLRAEGPLGKLSVSGRLITSAGFLEASGTFDARDPSREYEVQGSVEDFRIQDIVPGLADRTVVTGYFSVQGAGSELDSLSGSASLSLRESRIAGVDVDFLETRILASEGRLSLDQLELVSPVVHISGSGSLPLRSDQSDGEVYVIFSTSSLAALRPVFFGAEPILPDTLTELERDLLVLDGVDLDTLSSFDRTSLDGSAGGELRLSGSLEELSAGGFVEVSELVYGGSSIGTGRADVLGVWSREEGWGAEGVVDLEDLSVERFAFEAASGEVRYEPGRGEYRLDIRRDARETYRVRGTLAYDSLGVDVAVEALVLDLDSIEWSLAEPTAVRISGSRMEVDSLLITRPTGGGGRDVSIDARGVLDLEGESDLRVGLVGVDLDLLAGIARSDRFPSGVVDLSLEVHGPAASPRIGASLVIDEFAWNGAGLSRVEGTLDYEDQLLHAELVGELAGRTLLNLSGQVPLDLALQEVKERVLDREMDVTLSVDSLPAAAALAYLDVLEEVQGSISGEVQFSGTPTDLRPGGRIRLAGGSVLLSELGIRLSDVAFTLRPVSNGQMDVEGSVTSGGVARVSGSVDIADLTDPRFSLRISAEGFQAVDRRDMAIRFGGDVNLDGSYTQPQVSGQLRVEQGELFLEEFARTAEVVDLTALGLLEVLDTTFVGVRPVAETTESPFLQNLLVNVDLAFQRDFWLRSREMNVEIGGALTVTYDRPRRDLLLVGNLEAIRGTYDVFGRQFQVASGAVEFVGTPGINPALNIQAVTRLRRDAGEPVNITAQVQGTLVNPRVVLSSDAQPAIAESDLISYLIFGRPSYALASAESSVLQRAAGASVTLGVGAVASSLGSVVGREVGFDYFSITQTQNGAAGMESTAGLSGSLAYTQIEVGRYLGQDLFLTLVVRPLSGLGGVSQTFPGARVEWRFTDSWSVEGFVEDRFARQANTGFGTLGVRLSKVLGLTLYREWGY